MPYRNDEGDASTPTLAIPARTMAAIEHPAILTSLARGIDTMDGRTDYRQIVHPSGSQVSFPMYIRPDDPSASALSSHNSTAHNVVIAVRVPKRTGMKRKRGTDGPWEYDPTVVEPAAMSDSNLAFSAGRPPGDTPGQRDARLLRQKLKDNAGHYETEVVGLVKHSHRYRGLADFQQSVHDSEFMANVMDNLLPGDLSKLRNFVLGPGIAAPPNVDLPPPPFFTSHILPFPYFYTQNPFVREVSTSDGAVRLVNSTARLAVAGYLLGFDEEPVPDAPPPALPPISDRARAVLDAMQQALDERPVWTRRGLVNHMQAVTGLPLTENRLKQYFAHVCYQFKGGPWRDTLVRYGVDPRKDPSCRQYQTMFFKLHYHVDRKCACWHSVRERDGAGEAGGLIGEHIATPISADATSNRRDTHIFDGRSYCDDGKVWQVCDITDPFLATLLANAPQRPTCERVSAGWYHHGTWAKVRAVMRTKLIAIRFGRLVADAQYESLAAAVPHETPQIAARSIKVPVPDLHLTAEETALITHKLYHGRLKKRIRNRAQTVSVPILSASRSAAATNSTPSLQGMGGIGETGEGGEVSHNDEGEGEYGDGETDGDSEGDLEGAMGSDLGEDEDEEEDEGVVEVEDEDEDGDEDEDDAEGVEGNVQGHQGNVQDEIEDADRIAIKVEIMDDMDWSFS